MPCSRPSSSPVRLGWPPASPVSTRTTRGMVAAMRRRPDLSPADAEKWVAMVRMKRTALGLLVFVTLLFAFAHWQEPHHGWLGYVRAFAEAAMVGALAD